MPNVDLWVLPLPAQSHWFARVDWYLNWQMCKGLAHEKTKPSVELFRVMEEGGVAFQPIAASPKAPLMVISHGRLPTGQCVVLENGTNLKVWLDAGVAVAKNLRAKNLRVFLPTGSSAIEARKLCKDLTDCNIEFSADEDLP